MTVHSFLICTAIVGLSCTVAAEARVPGGDVAVAMKSGPATDVGAAQKKKPRKPSAAKVKPVKPASQAAPATRKPKFENEHNVSF